MARWRRHRGRCGVPAPSVAAGRACGVGVATVDTTSVFPGFWRGSVSVNSKAGDETLVCFGIREVSSPPSEALVRLKACPSQSVGLRSRRLQDRALSGIFLFRRCRSMQIDANRCRLVQNVRRRLALRPPPSCQAPQPTRGFSVQIDANKCGLYGTISGTFGTTVGTFLGAKTADRRHWASLPIAGPSGHAPWAWAWSGNGV